MSYGVYTKDLKACSASDMSLRDAKSWWREGRVVCSEKKICFGTRLTLTFLWNPKDWLFRWWYKWERKIYFGPFTFQWEKLHYTWADKVVYEGEVAKEGLAQ